MHYSYFPPGGLCPAPGILVKSLKTRNEPPVVDRRLISNQNPLKPLQLVEALAVLVSDFLKTLATGSGFDALLFFGRLFEALALLDIGNDAVLFAGLGETLESAFKRFVGLNNYADHDDPLVELVIRFWIAKYI